MNVKVCTGCNIEKDLISFGLDKKGKFGRNQKCKKCCNERAKKTVHSEAAIEKNKLYKAKWQKENKDKLNERRKIDYENNLDTYRKNGIRRQKNYRATEAYKEKHREYTKAYNIQNLEKLGAQQKLRRAINSKKLFRAENCEECGIKCKPDAHHYDYKKPLDVIWLCKKCHVYIHHSYKFHAKRLSEENPKGCAKVCSSEETTRGRVEELSPPSIDGQ